MYNYCVYDSQVIILCILAGIFRILTGRGYSWKIFLFQTRCMAAGGGTLWASPRNKRKIQLRFLKNQNITNTEQIRKHCWLFFQGFPPQPQKHSWEYANSTSPMLLGEYNFAEVWGLICGEFCCHSQYQLEYWGGWGGVVCSIYFLTDYCCPMCMVSLLCLLRMNIAINY